LGAHEIGPHPIPDDHHDMFGLAWRGRELAQMAQRRRPNQHKDKRLSHPAASLEFPAPNPQRNRPDSVEIRIDLECLRGCSAGFPTGA
jgi:hypothetical protein